MGLGRDRMSKVVVKRPALSIECLKVEEVQLNFCVSYSVATAWATCPGELEKAKCVEASKTVGDIHIEREAGYLGDHE